MNVLSLGGGGPAQALQSGIISAGLKSGNWCRENDAHHKVISGSVVAAAVAGAVVVEGRGVNTAREESNGVAGPLALALASENDRPSDIHERLRLRSPLRAGTALDGLAPARPLVNSLLERSALREIGAPIEPSLDFTRCSRFMRQLKKATEAVVRCDQIELADVAPKGIAQFHQPRVKEISGRKLASHIPNDPIDPVVIFVEAIPLAYRVLHPDRADSDGFDLDGVAYIIERLGDAAGLRTQEPDIRFDVLQSLSDFLTAVLEKAEEECWACVEAA